MRFWKSSWPQKWHAKCLPSKKEPGVFQTSVLPPSRQQELYIVTHHPRRKLTEASHRTTSRSPWWHGRGPKRRRAQRKASCECRGCLQKQAGPAKAQGRPLRLQEGPGRRSSSHRRRPAQSDSHPLAKLSQVEHFSSSAAAGFRALKESPPGSHCTPPGLSARTE